MKIADIDIIRDKYSPVTYIPKHAKGNASHPDCDRGVIIGLARNQLRVLFCKSRTIQTVYPEDLVWG